MDLILTILLLSAITVSVVEDIRRQKIPNLVTFPAMLIAIVFHGLTLGLSGLLLGLGGLALGMAIFIIPYMMGGMGAGDVKLMMAIGAILGPKGVILTSILTILFGGVYGLMLFALNPAYTASFLRRSWLTIKTYVLTLQFTLIPPESGGTRPALKYAIPIALGACAYLVLQITDYDLLQHLMGIDLSKFTFAKGGLF